MSFLPHLGVCLAIEPQEELDRLRAALETAPVFIDAPMRKHPFSAHMTIAEFISVEQTEALMGELEGWRPTVSSSALAFNTLCLMRISILQSAGDWS